MTSQTVETDQCVWVCSDGGAAVQQLLTKVGFNPLHKNLYSSALKMFTPQIATQFQFEWSKNMIFGWQSEVGGHGCTLLFLKLF